MPRHPRVLLAVASPASVDQVMLDKVARIASALDAEVELFQCVFDRRLAHNGFLATRPAQTAIRGFVESHHQLLERLALRLRARGVRARSSVRWDYPAHEGIIRQTLRHPPTLLIVHSSHRSGLGRRMARTDFRLIERSPVPVLLVQGSQPYPRVPVVLAAVDPRGAHGKPLALDDEIVDTARWLCTALRGELAIFHAHVPWEDAVRAARELRMVPEVVKDDVYRAYCGTVRDQVIELARRHHVPPSRVRTLQGEISTTLPAVAHEAGADIVVIGTVYRSMIRKSFARHTAERVLDCLKSDVLVVKPAAFRTSVRRQSTHHVDRTADVASRIVL